MSKKPQFQCSSCSELFVKWGGQCGKCKEWSTLEPYTERARPAETQSSPRVDLHSLATVTVSPNEQTNHRIKTGIGEWDRVMGGGLVPGSLLILTGDPGIGKSTLLLSVADKITRSGKKVLVFSSEESLAQIKNRATRIGVGNSPLLLSDIAQLDRITSTALAEKPDLVILDSIQNCYLSQSDTSLPGTVSQLREAGFRLMKLAKEAGITVLVTGHITKDGTMAGPKVLEHIVDGVFYLQSEDKWDLRILRTVKNRFGTVNELGFFRMSQTGLSEVTNINQHLISEHSVAPGAALTCSLEGSRALLLELQALCVATKFSLPQRVVTGVDPKRVLLIAAILEKYLHIKLSSFDIFFQVSGGCSIKESACDLGIALALLSSYFQKPLPEKMLPLGEICLTGAIKPINYLDQRLLEAHKFGIQSIYAAQKSNAAQFSQYTVLKSVYELLALFPED